jgi:hypothetical protein
MKNANGTTHIRAQQLQVWLAAWVRRVPRIDAGLLDDRGQPVPFDRDAIIPHAFRHTYAQTLADQGVPAPVLRDLMDHRSLDTTLGYYRVTDTRKRDAMQLMASHTIDNRGLWGPPAVNARQSPSCASSCRGGSPDGQMLRADQRARRRPGLPDPLPVRGVRPLRVRPLLSARAAIPRR